MNQTMFYAQKKNSVLNFPEQTSNLFANEWKKIHFSH